MDEYAEYIYKRRPQYRDLDPGDLSVGREIRERLKCKPFKWFMETIAFDLPLKYPPVEPDDFAFGEVIGETIISSYNIQFLQIRNLAAPEFCVDSDFKQREQEIGLKECIKDNNKNGEQNFTLTWHKDIRPKGRTMCWDVSDYGDKAKIVLYPCHGGKGNQYWRYDSVSSYFVLRN